jgi:hypothetical protein
MSPAEEFVSSKDEHEKGRSGFSTMNALAHIFVHVVPRDDDPFDGIRKQLAVAPEHHQMREVRLSSEAYECVRRVEYSFRKRWRFLYYAQVFRELETALEKALGDSQMAAVVYLPDEGVWAEFLRSFRRRWPRRFLAVNVQHGFGYLVRPRSTMVRRVVNAASNTLFGFPIFGMGSFGGVGAGVFEVYLTYDEAAASFIARRIGDLAFACPEVIKHTLLTRAHREREQARSSGQDCEQVVFAMQADTGGMFNRIRFTCLQTMEHLCPLARLLLERYQRRLKLRLHPGMDRERALQEFRHSGLAELADIDENQDLAATLARCSLVLSYDSTVLWEALLLGVTPVSVQGACFRGDLGFPHEVLQIDDGLPAALEGLFAVAASRKYAISDHGQWLDWEQVVSRLVKERLFDVNADLGQATTVNLQRAT